MAISTIKLDQLSLSTSGKVHISNTPKNLPRHKGTERFIKGPIPLNWILIAVVLPGKAFHVAVVIWYIAGLTGDRRVKLTQRELDNFQINRNAKYRALKLLEQAGLIYLELENGKNPVVTLLDVNT